MRHQVSVMASQLPPGALSISQHRLYLHTDSGVRRLTTDEATAVLCREDFHRRQLVVLSRVTWAFILTTFGLALCLLYMAL